MKKILLIGFGPFGAYRANSGEQLARLFRHTPSRASGFEVHSDVLPANIPSFDRGKQTLNMANFLQAEVIVIMGMCSSARGFVIERRARNKIHHDVYCSPETDGKPVEAGSSVDDTITCDLKGWKIGPFIKATRAAGLPTPRLSKNAGGFCCNHLMFQMRRAQEREKKLTDLPWIFLHIPCTPEAVPDPAPAEFTSGAKKTMTIGEIEANFRILLQTALPPGKVYSGALEPDLVASDR